MLTSTKWVLLCGPCICLLYSGYRRFDHFQRSYHKTLKNIWNNFLQYSFKYSLYILFKLTEHFCMKKKEERNRKINIIWQNQTHTKKKNYKIPFSKGMMMMMRSMPMYDEFHADHPFLYYIVDKLTNTVVFDGRIKNLKK